MKPNVDLWCTFLGKHFDKRRDGFLDWDNKLTPIGKHVAELMLQDFENYKSLFEVDVKKPPGYVYQKATHHLQ